MQKHSCAACARRKVKCDKLKPCSNCSRSQSQCTYPAPAQSQRHRKRPADEDLLYKIKEYEDLLRQNNVKFEPLDNSWIPSPLEDKLISRPPPVQPVSYNCGPLVLQPSNEVIRVPEPRGLGRQARISKASASTPQAEASRLWSSLPKELRDVTIEQLKWPATYPEDEEPDAPLRSDLATSLLIPVRLVGAPQLLELHPEPRHIFKLWQAFAEKVNPLTKIIHHPTLQQRIMEISWNLEAVAKPLEAVMFGVYALAVTSMKPADCVQAFGEPRSVLLNRYRSGAAQALIAAELHSTKDLEVLQAFVLFLLLDPHSDLSVTAIGTATRIAHRMGLHRIGSDPHMPFFEQEMGLRVWWQIIGLEARARRKVFGLAASKGDYGDVRLPLNVNDVDLHPNMANPAVEHSGATEMLFCLMKYEGAHYVRSRLMPSINGNTDEFIASTNPEAISHKRKVLVELEQVYEEKYLGYCDPSIPLHHISASVSRMTIHRVRFWFCHPRHQPDGGQNMSQADQDTVFESSIRLLQIDDEVRATGYSVHLLKHMLVRTQVEALVYMVSELRQRVSGELVAAAWALLEKMYQEFPQLVQDGDKFYTALADLTLQAWEARRAGAEAQGDAVPAFIGVLQGMRGDAGPGHALSSDIGGMVPDGAFQFELLDDDPLDWLYWNELPQL